MPDKSLCFCYLIKKKDYNIVTERIHFLNSYLDKLEKTLEDKVNYKNNSYTLIELAKKYECYFSVKWSECFLCKSYILTLCKKYNFQATYTCSYTLANLFKTSRTLSEKVIHQYQQTYL